MNKQDTRPTCVALTDLDDVVRAGVDRALQVNELTKDDLNDLTGGAIPGRMPPPGLLLEVA